MNIRLGPHFFADVDIPVLWGSRAILRDRQGHLSIINLEGEVPVLEVVDDKPARGAEFSPTMNGFMIIDRVGTGLYTLEPKTKLITSFVSRLPAVAVGLEEIRVGPNVLAGNIVAGIGVGMVITENGLTLGGPLPLGLVPRRV